MKKILFICLLFCFSTSYTYSNWYGNHAYSYTSSSGARYCDTDGDTTGGSHGTYGEGAAALNNLSSSTTPHGSSGISVSSSGNMRCLYWDAYDPDSLALTYSAGWHGPSGASITASGRDIGGAGVETIVIQERVNNTGPYTTVRTWSNLGGANGAIVSRTWTKVPVPSEENDELNYRVIVTDDAGNSTTFTNTDTIQFDMTAPTIGDIGVPSPTPGTNLLATNVQSISTSIAPSATGSPLGTVESYFEDYTSSTNTFGSLYSTTGPIHGIVTSIQLVDNDGSITDGVRQYTYKITRVCDAVGNCIGNSGSNPPALVQYNYDVYANTASITTRSFNTTQISDIQDANNISDGTTYTLTATLEDAYGNIIIPTASIGRQIDFSLNVDNSLYLNQFTRGGASGVRISPPSSASYSEYPIGIGNNNIFTNQPSSDGTYNFDFRVYAPSNHYSLSAGADPQARFIFNNVSFDVSHSVEPSWDNTSSIDNAPGIDFNFGPMFYTQFVGDLDNVGFLEGAVQDSDISVTKNSPRPLSNASSRKMYLKYNGDAAALNDLQLEFGQTSPPSEVVDEGSTLVTDIPSGFFSTTTYNLYTYLTQALGATIDSIEHTYLSSHLTYVIDGHSVTLNSDVIGRNNYFDTVAQNSSNQAGVKVLGVSASEKIQELTQDQFTDDVRIIGKLTKAGFRKDIFQRVFAAIRSVPDFSSSNPRVGELGASWESAPSNNGQIISNDTVMVYKNLGGDYVEITTDNIEGNKTIVVTGGDVYISGNIINNTINDILGIIALKDTAGNGGHIYIDTSVTDVHAILYAERALMTTVGDTNANGAIDNSAGSNEVISIQTTATQLSNQLYIRGSLFSENTIGGSRANPIECPFYLSCSDVVEAQKYDLNYMRRYIQVDHDNNPVTPVVNANGGITSNGTLGGVNENFPLVIEYNSSIQSSPPPLFK